MKIKYEKRKKPIFREVKVSIPYCPLWDHEMERPSNYDVRTLFDYQCTNIKCNYCC